MRQAKWRGVSWAVSFFLLAGCATHLTKPAKENVGSLVRFGEFKNVEMKAAVLRPPFADSAPNQKASKKIDEILSREMPKVFPGLKKLGPGESFSKSEGRTLQIEPVIKEIKFIGGAARFWVGALAGSSAVLMEVVYRDSATGKEIARPEFYAKASAMAGGWSIGGADNAMLERIVQEILMYSTVNR